MVTSRERDAEAMRQRILAALGRMIVRDGLLSVGVNALAREAGCDKVLIYRYFGDLDGLYDAFAALGDFWWTVEEITEGIDADSTSLAQALKIVLRRHAESIQTRPITLAVLAAEPVERTPLVVALERVRERRSLAMMAWLGARYAPPGDVDLEAIAMLLGTALNYLAVRARKIRIMSGVPIKTANDWERIHAAVEALIDGALK